MILSSDFKFWLAIFTSLLTVWAFYGYFRDIFKKKTKPHVYTWLVWSITQGTATAALVYGGGQYGAMSLVVGTIIVIAIFFLSLKYGTRNITTSDTVVLIAAFLAIIVWWQLKNPLLAVFMASAIDGLGYIPTFRKSYQEPWSETLVYWFNMSVLSVLTMASNTEYNLLTLTYLTVIALANITVWLICLIRRRVVPSPHKPKLIVVNGPCGIGKNTIAEMYKNNHHMSLMLDIDGVRRTMGEYGEYKEESYKEACDLALAEAKEHLNKGYDVIIPNIINRLEFLDTLEKIAHDSKAKYYEIVLWTTKEDALDRAIKRGFQPGSLLQKDSLDRMYNELDLVIKQRKAIVVIKSEEGRVEETYQELMEVLVK